MPCFRGAQEGGFTIWAILAFLGVFRKKWFFPRFLTILAKLGAKTVFDHFFAICRAKWLFWPKLTFFWPKSAGNASIGQMPPLCSPPVYPLYEGTNS